MERNHADRQKKILKGPFKGPEAGADLEGYRKSKETGTDEIYGAKRRVVEIKSDR